MIDVFEKEHVMYLVSACCYTDDLPLALFTSWEHAFEFAKQWMPDEGAMYDDILGKGICTVLGVQIVKFENGRPINLTTVKWDEDESGEYELRDLEKACV